MTKTNTASNNSPTYTHAQLELAANTIRMLSADGVEKANSGHPGMPMGMADIGAVLFLKHLRFNPKDPAWLNRDRFVLSNGHGSMFLYSVLHLCGYDLSLEDLKSFRQWHSKTPGHPESFMTPGVECTTGPLGQGISNAVGMAIGQRLLATRYGLNDLLNHRIFCFAGDGCLMEGVSSEACSIAGHLGLNNLIVIYDDNHISIAGHTELAFTENVLKRYEAYGWNTLKADGHSFDDIDRAIQSALSVTDRPTIIAARTIIGKGSPNKANTHDVHGSPLGKDEMAATKKNLNWPQEPTFYIPDEVKKLFAARVETLSGDYKSWQSTFSDWQKAHPEQAGKLQAQLRRELPKDLLQRLVASLPNPPVAASTRKLSSTILHAASKEVSALVGGSADLEPSTLTFIKGSPDVQRDHFAGVNLRFGVREHGMGAVMNGLSYYGGYIPYGSTFLCFSDYMRPTLRIAALSKLPGLFIYTHESVFLGEDGPTHQPIEHAQALRLIPNLWVFRPADGFETAASYTMAIERRDGPSAMLFTRQNLTPLENSADFDPAIIRRGAYAVISGGDAPKVVFVATGSEVPLAIASAKLLNASSISCRVVSMPCYEVFAMQDEKYRRQLIPANANVVTVEAGLTFGWAQMLELDAAKSLQIGIDQFGASAPAEVIAEKLGLTPQAIFERVKTHFKL